MGKGGIQTRTMDSCEDTRDTMSAAQAPPFTFPSTSASSTLAADHPTANPNRTPSPQHGPMSARHQQMKRFARSADKRQSVHMLGSIQHLQRHFVSFVGTASRVWFADV